MECEEFGFAILHEIPCNYIFDLSREKVPYFNNKNAITLMRANTGKKVNWAQIMYKSLCNELDR
jgi:hypothetical protein